MRTFRRRGVLCRGPCRRLGRLLGLALRCLPAGAGFRGRRWGVRAVGVTIWVGSALGKVLLVMRFPVLPGKQNLVAGLFRPAMLVRGVVVTMLFRRLLPFIRLCLPRRGLLRRAGLPLRWLPLMVSPLGVPGYPVTRSGPAVLGHCRVLLLLGGSFRPLAVGLRVRCLSGVRLRAVWLPVVRSQVVPLRVVPFRVVLLPVLLFGLRALGSLVVRVGLVMVFPLAVRSLLVGLSRLVVPSRRGALRPVPQVRSTGLPRSAGRTSLAELTLLLG